MQTNLSVVLLLYLLPFLAESSSSTDLNEGTVGGKACEQMLETFWKSSDLNIEGEHQLITTEELNAKQGILNEKISEKDQLVEFQRESMKHI